MKLIKYNYFDKKQITTHFNSSEWKCKCGDKHDFMIADTLPTLLEKLMLRINAYKGVIISGYRCKKYDKKVGGTGSSTHQGYACDIKFYDKNNKAILSKKVVLALEDLKHKNGIGYRSGGNKFLTHIDVKSRKWYGDEAKSMTSKCCESFYDYFGIKNNNLILLTGVFGRIGGIGFNKKRLLFYKGTKIENVTYNVGNSNNYNWIKGYVSKKLIYFPYNKKWYKKISM